MFTDQELSKINFLRSGPVLRTKAGCRKRCEAIDCEDLRLLIRYFHCSVDEVPQELHTPPGGVR